MITCKYWSFYIYIIIYVCELHFLCTYPSRHVLAALLDLLLSRTEPPTPWLQNSLGRSSGGKRLLLPHLLHGLTSLMRSCHANGSALQVTSQPDEVTTCVARARPQRLNVHEHVNEPWTCLYLIMDKPIWWSMGIMVVAAFFSPATIFSKPLHPRHLYHVHGVEPCDDFLSAQLRVLLGEFLDHFAQLLAQHVHCCPCKTKDVIHAPGGIFPAMHGEYPQILNSMIHALQEKHSWC